MCRIDISSCSSDFLDSLVRWITNNNKGIFYCFNERLIENSKKKNKVLKEEGFIRNKERNNRICDISEFEAMKGNMTTFL